MTMRLLHVEFKHRNLNYFNHVVNKLIEDKALNLNLNLSLHVNLCIFSNCMENPKMDRAKLPTLY